jgi:hypothetical protein
VTDKSDRVLLRYEIDEASLNRTIARANAAREKLAQMRGTLAQINQAAQPTGDALRKMFDGAEKSASKLSARLDEIAKKRLRGTLPSQAGGVDDLRLGGASSGGGSNNINRIEGLLSRSGAAFRGLGGGAAGELLSGGGDILQLVGSLGELGPAALAGGVALGAVTVGLKLMSAAAEASKQNLDAAFKAQTTFYTQFFTLTTDQAKDQLAAEEKKQKGIRAAIEETEKALAPLRKRIDQSGEGTDIPALIAAAELEKQLKTFKDTAGEADHNIARLTNGLKDGTFAANDAAEAERKLSEARIKAFQEDLERSRKIAAVTSQEQVDEQVSSIQAQIDANKKWLEKNAERIAGDEQLAETFEKVEEETKKLQKDLDALANTLPSVVSRTEITDDLERGNELEDSLVDSREREFELIEKAGEAMNSFADELDRVAEDRKISAGREQQDFTIKRARDQAEFTRRQAESDTAYYKDRGKKVAAFNREMAETDNEAQKARIKAIQESNDAQIKAAEDFARTVRGFTEQINDAGANLDAIGVRNAQRGLKDATDQYNSEKRGRDADAKKRIDEIAENAKAQKDARMAAFAEELADADAEHAIEQQKDREEFLRRQQIEDQDRALRLQRQQEDYARQDAARRAAFDKQVMNLRTQLLEPEERAKNASYANQRAALNNFLNGAVDDINNAKSRVSNTTTTDASRSSAMTTATVPRISTQSSFSRGFKDGGRPPMGVPVMVGERGPEPVIFDSPGQVYKSGTQFGSGVNIGDIYLNGGLAPDQYKAMVKQGIAEAFSEAMN